MVYSDNGSHFVKGVFPELLRTKGIRHVTAPITHPSSVGMAESTVRLVLGQLRKQLQSAPGMIFEWDMQIPSITAQLNSRTPRVLRWTPAQLLFGWKPRFISALESFEDELRSAEMHSRIS